MAGKRARVTQYRGADGDLIARRPTRCGLDTIGNSLPTGLEPAVESSGDAECRRTGSDIAGARADGLERCCSRTRARHRTDKPAQAHSRARIDAREIILHSNALRRE